MAVLNGKRSIFIYFLQEYIIVRTALQGSRRPLAAYINKYLYDLLLSNKGAQNTQDTASTVSNLALVDCYGRRLPARIQPLDS